MKRNSLFSTVSILIISSSEVAANSLLVEQSYFPLIPRLTINGATGDGNGVGESMLSGDGMLPLVGNSSRIFYLDIQGKTGFDHSWVGSGGLGYRQAQGNERILGGYLFVDRNISNENNTFWVLSPGIESMGQIWDFRANAYFPVGSHKAFIRENFTSNFGDNSDIVSTGHTQLDTLSSQIERISVGLDGEIGRTIPLFPGLSTYVGGYYFNVGGSADNITGGEARVEYAVNRYLTFNLIDTYDNVTHNTFGVEFKLTFGGININPQSRKDIKSRIEDPIERNISTFLLGNGTPIVETLEQSSGLMIKTDNIWFFKGNNSKSITEEMIPITLDSCTAENPCSSIDFNQAAINTIATLAPHANYYFTRGIYSADNLGQQIILLNGESLFGRRDDFKAPAAAKALPLFNGGFEIQGNNQNYLFEHIQINNSTTVDSLGNRTGVSIGQGNQLTINKSIMDISGESFSQNQTLAAIYNNGSTVNLKNSNMNINATNFTTDNINGSNTGIFGIFSDTGILNVDSSAISMNAQNNIGNHVEFTGIFALNNSTIHFKNSAIVMDGIKPVIGKGQVIGIHSRSSNVDILNSSIRFSAENEGVVIGYAQEGGYGTIKNSSISATFDHANEDVQAGIFVAGGNLLINNSEISVNVSNSNSAVGIQAFDNGGPTSINIKHTLINMNSMNSGDVVGVAAVQQDISSPVQVNLQNSAINIDGTATNMMGLGANGGTILLSKYTEINLSGGKFGFIVNDGKIIDNGTTQCNGNNKNCNF